MGYGHKVWVWLGLTTIGYVLTPLSLYLACAGFGILVSTRAKPTRARYTVRDPASVLAFLTRVVEWGKTTGNGWHAKPSCNGWSAESL